MADGYISLVTLPNNNTYDIKDDGAARGNGRVFYGTCSTSAATYEKEVICNDYDELKNGDIMIVKFAYTNSATANNSLKLKITNQGTTTTTEAKSIKKQYNSTGANNLSAVGELNSGGISVFVYNGTYWILTNADYNSNTNTLLRTYALDLDAERPLLAQTQSTTAWTHYTSGYNDWYGAIPNSATKCATINMSTGKITATGFKGDGSELINLAPTSISGVVTTSNGEFLKDTGEWELVDWSNLTGIPNYSGCTAGFIAFPEDGYYKSTSSANLGKVTGYLRIKIPQSVDSTMFTFDIDIYNYRTTNQCTRYHIGGYNYNDNRWINCTAYCIAPMSSPTGNLTVRFLTVTNTSGNTTTYDKYVTIGEPNTIWYWPKAKVHSIFGNIESTKLSNWVTGWTVTLDTTAFDDSLIQATFNNTNIAYTIPVNAVTVPSSAKTVGYLPLSTTTTGVVTLLAQDSLYLYDTVSSGAFNASYLGVGKSGSIRGGLSLHAGSTTALHGDLVVTTALTGNRTYTLPNTTGDIAVYSSGAGNASTLDWGTTYTLAKLNGTDIKFTTMSLPVVSVASLTGTVSATDLRTQLGLSAALRFIGKVASNSSFTPSDGGTGAPTVTGVTSYTPIVGDVVLDKDSDSEYVCISVSGTTYTWERLGRDSSWALSDHTHGDITNDGKIGSTANLPVITGTNGALTTASTMYINNTKLAINSTTAPTENLYVKGKVKIDLGSSDGVSQKNFLIQGSTRALSVGGAGILAYNSDGSAVAACYIQNAGGDLYIGNTTSASSDNRYCYGLYTFSTTGGFNYSGMEQGTTDVSRNVWFSSNTARGKPTYNDNFKYNPASHKITLGKLTITGGTADSTIAGTGTLTLSTAADKTFTISAGSTIYIKSGTSTSILFQRGSTNVARFDTASAFRPESTKGASLGTSSYLWNNVFASHIELIHTEDENDKSLNIKYGSTIDFYWGVGTANTNHGMYDSKAGDWIILAGSDNVWSFKGTALNATNVAATLATTSKAYLLGTTTTITGTAANVAMVGDTGVYLTTTAGQLSAKSYSVNDGTNEKVKLQWNSTDSALDFIFN